MNGYTATIFVCAFFVGLIVYDCVGRKDSASLRSGRNFVRQPDGRWSIVTVQRNRAGDEVVIDSDELVNEQPIGRA